MYILMTDETNTRGSESARFFIYGGLILETSELHSLTSRIQAIRTECGLMSGDPLKFDTNSRPDTVLRDDYTAAKNAVIEACFDHDAQFLAYMILHDIATEGNEILIGYGLNTLLSVFNFKFLDYKDDSGIVVVDRLPFKGDYDFLRTKFAVGLEFDEPSGRQASLDRIDLFASSCDGASHLSSAVDIVLGAFRFCVNKSGQSTIPEVLFPKVARMLYGVERDGTRYIREYGLTTRPKQVIYQPYAEEYDEVVERLSDLAAKVD